MQSADKLEFAIVLYNEAAIMARTQGEAHAPLVSPYRIARLAETLMRIGRRLHRLAEEACNTGDGAVDAQIEKTRSRATTELAPYGVKPLFGGDPRGCVFQLILPITKVTNGWAGEGYCVPR